MNVEINEIAQNVYNITLSTFDPDLLALAVRAETAAGESEEARDTALQYAQDALVSEQAAAVSEGNALTSEQAAAVSEGNALTSEQNAAQSAGDAEDALLQIGGFYDLEDAPGYDAGSAGQSLNNVGGVLVWQ